MSAALPKPLVVSTCKMPPFKVATPVNPAEALVISAVPVPLLTVKLPAPLKLLNAADPVSVTDKLLPLFNATVLTKLMALLPPIVGVAFVLTVTLELPSITPEALPTLSVPPFKLNAPVPIGSFTRPDVVFRTSAPLFKVTVPA